MGRRRRQEEVMAIQVLIDRRSCSICGEPLASIADVAPARPDSPRILLPQRLRSP
jgi:hypothetical protein